MRLFFVVILVVLGVNLSFGFEKAKVVATPVIKVDTSNITVRHFDSVALKHYSKLPEFSYQQSNEGPSLWTRFWRWFWNLFERSASSKQGGKFIQVLLYILKYLILIGGAIGLIFLITKLLGIDMIKLFRRKSASATLPYSEYFEDIHAISFDEELEDAVNKKNYRLAVRLLYLQCLKVLSDQDLINWQPDKTNSAYINELQNHEKSLDFALLTRQFEYVWYGEFAIDNTIYKQIESLFQTFNNKRP